MTARMMTSQQAADALQVHRSTVHRWVHKGLLEPAQVVEVSTDDGPQKLYLFDAGYVAELAARQQTP